MVDENNVYDLNSNDSRLVREVKSINFKNDVERACGKLSGNHVILLGPI